MFSQKKNSAKQPAIDHLKGEDLQEEMIRAYITSSRAQKRLRLVPLFTALAASLSLLLPFYQVITRQQLETYSEFIAEFRSGIPEVKASAAESLFTYIERGKFIDSTWPILVSQYRSETEVPVLNVMKASIVRAYQKLKEPEILKRLAAIQQDLKAEIALLQARVEQAKALTAEGPTGQTKPLWVDLKAAIRGKQKALISITQTLGAIREQPLVLSDMPLQGFDFAEINLEAANMRRAQLQGSNLSAVILKKADLRDANLAQANLQDANLQEANLFGVDLSGANLKSALLQGANLTSSVLMQANLTLANLENVSLREVVARHALFSGAKFSGADFYNADFSRTDLSSTNLMNTNLHQTALIEADLTEVNATQAFLGEADLTRANLTNAIFWKANFTGAKITGTDFTNARCDGQTEFKSVDGLGEAVNLDCAFSRPGPERSTAVSRRPQTLSVALLDDREGEGMRAALKVYAKQHPGLKITVHAYPYEKLFHEIRYDSRQYDVVLLDDPWIPFLADQQLLLDLSELAVDLEVADFSANSLRLGHHPYPEGPLYALPLVGNVTLLFYNSQYIAEAPQSFAQALQLAAQFHNPEQGRYGYAIRGASGNPLVANFLPILWSFGGEVLTGKNLCHTPLFDYDVLKALDFFLKLKELSPPAARSYDSQEIMQALNDGDVAMAVEWASWASWVDEHSGGRVKYAELPAGEGEIGVPSIGDWLLGIPRHLHDDPGRQQQAYHLVEWLTGPEGMRLSAEHGSAPVRRSLLRDPQLKAKYPVYDVLIEALETARPRPRVADWIAVRGIFAGHLTNVMSGERTPWKAMQAAAAQIGRRRANAAECWEGN